MPAVVSLVTRRPDSDHGPPRASAVRSRAVHEQLDGGGGGGGDVDEQDRDAPGVAFACGDAQYHAVDLHHASPARRLPGQRDPGPDDATVMRLDQRRVPTDVVQTAGYRLARHSDTDGQVDDDTRTLAPVLRPQRTFTTTSVRSSARRASPRNISTSDRIRSPSSAAVLFAPASICAARRAVP